MHLPRMRGMSLIDVIVGTALMLVLFLALLGVLRASLLVSTLAKAKSSATAIAETQMEYLRSLSYDSLGTVGGIPAGVVPEYATTTQDGINFVAHSFISYVDDPADGTGASDANGITTDYKRARVLVSYVISRQPKTVTLVSNFAPLGLETSTGGGTLEIKVVDAAGAGISGATVQITNASTSPAVNLTTYSDVTGTVYLPGAATSSSYQVAVSKTGYSSAQTYARDTTNQNPNPGYLTVSKNRTTIGTFAIDLLSQIAVATFAPVATSTFSDSFSNASKIAAMSSTTASGGALALDAGEISGSARSVATSSAYLARWGVLSASTTIPSGSGILVHVYDGSGALLPDAALPGNAAGFSAFPVALYALSTTTYPSLAIGADFTSDGTAVPSVQQWSLSYQAGPVPLGGVSFALTGTKTKGSTGAGVPIPKTVVSTATGNDGTQGVTLEWDSYALSVSGYDVQDACPSPPYAVAPGATLSATLIAGPATANSLRVLVTDNAGTPVSGASVTLSRTGYTKTVTSSSCGSAYFGGISAASDYAVSISKTGYTTANSSGISVSGATVFSASFP